MIKTNFHTHTLYCDGKDTPEAIIATAIAKNFTALGFSGHSFFQKDEAYCMSATAEARYYNEITALKEKYQEQIEIFCGIEQDFYSAPPKYPYNYKIGSVHNVYKDGKYLVVDGSTEELRQILNEHYSDEFDLFAKDYFATVCDVIKKTDADIIGHFDLILKNQERICYTPSPSFYSYAQNAVHTLLAYHKPFEINTGAMARGYRTTPYPDYKILKFIYDGGGDIIFSSDCHAKEDLDFGLADAKALAKKIGFSRQAVVTKNGIQYIALDI